MVVCSNAVTERGCEWERVFTIHLCTIQALVMSLNIILYLFLQKTCINDTFVYNTSSCLVFAGLFEYFFVFVFAGIVYLRQTKNVVVVFSHVGREQKRPLLKVGALSEGPELIFEY